MVTSADASQTSAMNVGKQKVRQAGVDNDEGLSQGGASRTRQAVPPAAPLSEFHAEHRRVLVSAQV